MRPLWQVLLKSRRVYSNPERVSVCLCVDWQSLMEVNYLGSIYPTRAVITTMKERRMGRIVFMSSQAGQIGLFGYTAYSPSKFALRGLAESLQMEVSTIRRLPIRFRTALVLDCVPVWLPSSHR